MAKSDIYRAPVGTKDVFGLEARKWEAVVSKFAKIARLNNFDQIITPMFENYEVFMRMGEDSDVVTKEMYDFEDKGGRHIALRPEGTAGVVRAFSEHRPLTPFKAWYLASVFRYERPQKGRLREHHQLGIEVIGVDDPIVDVEVIKFGYDFLKSCGIGKFNLVINSLGDSDAREAHEKELRSYFEGFKKDFDEEFAKRVDKNPFRVLDTKVPEWREVADNAPSILDFISENSKADFEFVKAALTALDISFIVKPSLVRGLDYYTNTAFEFISTSLDSAQSTLCAGGRYNKLVEELGGPKNPGIGFGLGVERLLLALESEGIEVELGDLDFYLINLANTEQSKKLILQIADQIRNNGRSVDICYGEKSVKSAFKNADRIGAKRTIILGDTELDRGVITLKDMSSGEQSEIDIENIAAVLKK